MGVPGGVALAQAVSNYVTKRAGDYAQIVATADWHIDPGDHWSDQPDFHDSWPVHCEVGTPGADFHPGLEAALAHVNVIVRKGQYEAAYSGFEGATDEGERLAPWLRDHDIDAVDIVGIATDHCVRATAVHASQEGLSTRVLLDLTAGVSPEGIAAAETEMRSAGIELARSG